MRMMLVPKEVYTLDAERRSAVLFCGPLAHLGIPGDRFCCNEPQFTALGCICDASFDIHIHAFF